MKFLFLAVFLVLATPAFAQESVTADLKKAHGDWSKLERIKFSWTVVPRNMTRTYDWDVKAGQVTVGMGDEAIRIPASGVGLKEPKEIEAHKAFINDSYWLLFEQFIFRDKVSLTSDTGPVPNSDKTARRVRVEYSSGGYTPGDTYRLYVGDDGVVFGWEYFPGGASEARFYMTREAHLTQAGVTVPTVFKQNGEVFIKLDGIELK